MIPRVTTSIRSSMISLMSLRNRRPTVRKPRRGEGPPVVAQGQAVGGDLLDDEAVVRLVLVERSDHVIAIGVRVGIAPLLGEDVPLGVGIAGHVEPVPAPGLRRSGGRLSRRSTTRANAWGDSSARKASTSSGDRGEPGEVEGRRDGSGSACPPVRRGLDLLRLQASARMKASTGEAHAVGVLDPGQGG